MRYVAGRFEMTNSDEESLIDLEIVFPIDGFGTDEDNRRKDHISEVLRSLLTSLNLGYWTGDSIGSDTFEIGMQVFDVDNARRAILDVLRVHGLAEGVRFEEI
jgi:hypothetical protein